MYWGITIHTTDFHFKITFSLSDQQFNFLAYRKHIRDIIAGLYITSRQFNMVNILVSN